MMHVTRLCALEYDGNCRALFCSDEILLYRGNRKKGRYRDVVFVNSSVGQDEDIRAVSVCSVTFYKGSVDCFLKRGILVVQERHGAYLESGLVHRAYLHEVDGCEYGVVYLEHIAVVRLFFEQISVRADINRCVRDDLLSE